MRLHLNKDADRRWSTRQETEFRRSVLRWSWSPFPECESETYGDACQLNWQLSLTGLSFQDNARCDSTDLFAPDGIKTASFGISSLVPK